MNSAISGGKKRNSNIFQIAIIFLNEFAGLNKGNYIHEGCMDFSVVFVLILHSIII